LFQEDRDCIGKGLDGYGAGEWRRLTMAGEVNCYDLPAAFCKAVDDKLPRCPTSANAMYE